MKHYLYILTAAMVLLACSKKANEIPAPPDTTLQITAKDAAGNLLPGAIIKLYASKNNFDLGLTETAMQITGSNGSTVFTHLAGQTYWFRIDAGCKSNLSGLSSTSTSANVMYGISNSAIVKLESLGTLKMVNNSSAPYKVYVNGTLMIASMSGGITSYIYYLLAGNYDIRVVQLSGFAISPTDKTYSGVLVCGGTLQTVFP